MHREMDIEFHYYINYMLAVSAGFAPKTAYKIAYSSQYVDDNTEKYTIFHRSNAMQYNNIITQSLNPMLHIKDMMAIYPIFHFIPGDGILKSSSLRRDGQFRYMTTTPNNRLARSCLRSALKSKDPYWIGVASHSFVDTWAHQNFTGLKDSYNAVDRCQMNKSLLLNLGISAFAGHANVLGWPDDPSKIWYDYRLKDIKVDNSERFLDAALHLFKFYLKYGDDKMLVNKPQNADKTWNKIKKFLSAVFKGDIELLDTSGVSQSNVLIMKLIGLNKSSRIDFYKNKIRSIEDATGQFSFKEYSKDQWFEDAIIETSDSIEMYKSPKSHNIQPVNDNGEEEKCEYVLGDSGTAKYCAEDITTKLRNVLAMNKSLYAWKNINYKKSDWYCFQEAAKKQYDYLIKMIVRIMQKDINSVREVNR